MSRRNRIYFIVGIALRFGFLFSCPVNAGETEMDIHVRSRKILPNKQECGIESLYLLLRQQGVESISYGDLKNRIPMTSQGVCASDLTETASLLQCELEAIKINLDTLLSRNKPAILHVNGDHFIVFLHIENSRLVLFDSEIGLYDCSSQWFSRHYLWEGTVLVARPYTTLAGLVTSGGFSVFLLLIIIITIPEVLKTKITMR